MPARVEVSHPGPPPIPDLDDEQEIGLATGEHHGDRLPRCTDERRLCDDAAPGWLAKPDRGLGWHREDALPHRREQIEDGGCTSGLGDREQRGSSLATEVVAGLRQIRQLDSERFLGQPHSQVLVERDRADDGVVQLVAAEHQVPV